MNNGYQIHRLEQFGAFLQFVGFLDSKSFRWETIQDLFTQPGLTLRAPSSSHTGRCAAWNWAQF